MTRRHWPSWRTHTLRCPVRFYKYRIPTWWPSFHSNAFQSADLPGKGSLNSPPTVCHVWYRPSCLSHPEGEESRLPYSIPHTYSFILPTFLSGTHVPGRHTRQEETVTAPVKQPRQGTQEPTTAFPLTPHHHVNHHEGCHTASTQRHTVYLATT